MLFDNFLMRSTATDTILLWPCAVSTTIRSHSASISASVRSSPLSPTVVAAATRRRPEASFVARSEEHTSELQSLMRISYAVFCLKKKKRNTYEQPVTQK